MGKKRVIKKGEEGAAEVIPASTGTASKKTSKNTSKKIREGRFYIYASYNNTLIAFTDAIGNVIAQTSAGAVGFKGTKKSTPFAASKVAEALSLVAKNKGLEQTRIFLRGIGPGRDSALRSIGAKGFDILSIEDLTPVPHNGPRPRKVRRV